MLTSASLIMRRSSSVREMAPNPTTSLSITVQFSPFSTWGCCAGCPVMAEGADPPAGTPRKASGPYLAGSSVSRSQTCRLTMSKTLGWSVRKTAKSLVCATRACTPSSAMTLARAHADLQYAPFTHQLARAPDGQYTFSAIVFDADLRPAAEYHYHAMLLITYSPV